MELKDLAISNDWRSFLEFRNRRLNGLQTGLLKLDKVLLGLSGITLIQGAPGSNKSTLALQIAAHNSATGTPVLIVDRENGLERFRMRLLCQTNRVSSVDVLTAGEEQLGAWVSTVYDFPLFVSTDAPSIDEIEQLLQQLWEQFQRPMLLVIDSLQALPMVEENERLSIQTWLNHLDQLKLDWEGKLTMLVTSEKSRGNQGDNYLNASLSSAKGAGAIEYKAEIVLDLRRVKDSNDLVCEIVKSRDGLANLAVDLRPVLADQRNPQSFCFKLEEV